MARATIDVASPTRAPSTQASNGDLSELAGSALPAAPNAATADVAVASPIAEREDKDKTLPLPGWLVKVYFIFPVILYVPDVIFNYFVYSDGVPVSANALVHAGEIALWGFLSVGVVGMAYLLSVLAPWHWGQGHRIQAFFCGFGVIIATAITTWNSLAYRSGQFIDFPTDKWAYSLWPQLQVNHTSVTMILVAVAPPFWGLFWAIVQPTETGRSMRQLRESHAERLLRLQQEAEVKSLRAQTNAKIREAQLRGMASTAAAAREQAKGLVQRREETQAGAENATTTATATDVKNDSSASSETSDSSSPHNASPASEGASNVLQLPTLPVGGRETSAGHNDAAFYNHGGATTLGTHTSPITGASTSMGQPTMLSTADVQGNAGMPLSDAMATGTRRPPLLGANFDLGDDDLPTGSTGPRPSVRRSVQPGSLVQNVGELPTSYVRAVEDAMRQLNIPPTKRSGFSQQFPQLVAEKLNIDEQMAKTVITRVLRARDNQRGQR